MAPRILTIDSDELTVKANEIRSSEFGKTVDAHGLELGFGKLGKIAGNFSISGESSTNMEVDSVDATLDISAVDNAFRPHLLGEGFSAKGNINLAVQRASFSTDAKGPPPFFAGKLSAHDAVFSVRGLGELPPLDVDMNMEWPALKTCSLKFADIGLLTCGVENIATIADPATWGTTTNISAFRFDFGRFCRSATGHRLLSAAPGGNEPVPIEAPLAFSGILFWQHAGDALDGTVFKKRSGKDERDGFEFRRDWRQQMGRFPLRLPDWKFSGPVSAGVEFEDGAAKTGAIAVSLTGKKSAGVAMGATREFFCSVWTKCRWIVGDAIGGGQQSRDTTGIAGKNG